MGWETFDLRKLAADLGRAEQDTPRLASMAVRKTAFDIEGTSKAAAQRLFRPPPEGDATGATASSISVETVGDLECVIGPTTHYSPYLEHGTRLMAARPFMGPSADEALPGFEAALAQIGGRVLG